MLKNNKWWIVLAVLAVLLAAWFYINSRNTIKIKTAPVVIGEIVPVVNVSGEIKGSDVSLSSKIGGKLIWIGVKEGDSVRAGQILAKFDNYENAENDYIRMKTLYESGFATQQQFELAKLSFENAYISSIISGIAVSVPNKVGETVVPGQSVVSVADPKSAYAEVQIDEADIGDVAVPKDVKLYCDAYPNEIFKGELINITQKAELKKIADRVKMDEENKVFRGEVKFADPSYKLKIGMSVNADIIVLKQPQVLVVPRESVLGDAGLQYVFVIKNGKAKKAEIKLGLKDSSNVQVISGLVSGDAVAATMLDKLKDGSRVSIEK